MKIGLILVLCLFLTGCAAAAPETVCDTLEESVLPEPGQIQVVLPEEAVSPASENDPWQLYLCDGYELTLYTCRGGDLLETIRQVTGFAPENLTVMHREGKQGDRYDFVWTAGSEEGQLICRSAIWDDGNWHYILTAQTEEGNGGQVQEVWSEIFASFCVKDQGSY